MFCVKVLVSKSRLRTSSGPSSSSDVSSRGCLLYPAAVLGVSFSGISLKATDFRSVLALRGTARLSNGFFFDGVLVGVCGTGGMGSGVLFLISGLVGISSGLFTLFCGLSDLATGLLDLWIISSSL